MKKKFLILAFAAALISFASADETERISVKRENGAGTLNISVLENGLAVFTERDTTSALVRVELVVKAGFSRQTPSTAGFFPLYTNLFFSSAEKIKDFSPRSSCNADSANYTADVSTLELAEYFDALSDCASRMHFTDKAISKEFRALKEQTENYALSSAGFINSSIDARVFSDSPWTQDSGIYPSLFSSYTLAECRAVLESIFKTYYTPENSALFVTGNISQEEVLKLAEKSFSHWEQRKSADWRFAGAQNASGTQKKSSGTQNVSDARKYVLTAPWLPKDMTQII